MPKVRATTALIWNYFEIGDLAAKKAVCKYCKNSFSYKTTVTNLKLHLKKKHIGVYEEYCRVDLTTNSGHVNTEVSHDGLPFGDSGKEVDSGHGIGVLLGEHAARIHIEPVTSTSSSVTGTETVAVASTSTCTSNVQINHRSRKTVQKTVSYYVPKKLVPNEKAQIDKCLLKLITTDLQPFSVVENKGFKEYTHALNPNYELPHRKKLSNQLLLAEYENQLQATKQMINDFCSSICLTADCWTSRTLVPYIAITGHFIHTETLEYKSILIKCSALEDSHTGVNLAEELKKNS